MPKNKISYWKRYDLLYKNYSKVDLVRIIEVELRRSGLIVSNKRGRKRLVRREKSVSFILVEKIEGGVYRKMELEGDAYVVHKYDHSSYHEHYQSLTENILLHVIGIFENKCKTMLNEIIFHIADSTALSTSV